MKKLKLEDLAVTSFETTSAVAGERGTVQGHAPPASRQCPIQTYNVDLCGDTQYFDCTLGCSHLTNCPDCIVQLETADCAAA